MDQGRIDLDMRFRCCICICKASSRRVAGAVARSCRLASNVRIPLLGYPPEVRKLIYTTNYIEALNSKILRAVRTRAHFPSYGAAAKLIYLAHNATSSEWKRSIRERHAVR